MITKPERDELLSEIGLSEEELRMVFTELGVDYDADEFNEDLIEKVEVTAQAMGLAVSKVKAIAAAAHESPVNSEMVATQIGEMMLDSLSSQGISLSPEVILSLAQAKAEQWIKVSDGINQLARRIYAAREEMHNTQFANDLFNQSTQAIEVIEEILSDEAQQRIIESLTPQVRLNGEVQKFRNVLEAKSKARQQIGAKREEAIAALPPVDPKDFVRKFLASRNG